MIKTNLPGKSTLSVLQPQPEIVRLRGNNIASQYPPGFPPIQKSQPPSPGSLPNSGYQSNVWFGNVDEEAVKVNNEKIAFDEVKLPPSIYASPVSVPAIPTVSADNFYLMVRGKMIHTTSTMEEMEEVIQYYLFSDQTDYSDLTIEDVIVLKKMVAKVGVSLRDG